MTVDGNGFGIWIRDVGWISLKLALAFALTLPIGLHRQTSHAGIGLRTFPLAATASCAYVLLALAAFPHAEEARSRIIQGLITGIGFIGGGAILKTRATVRGKATAASIWSTGAIGATVAQGAYAIAVAISVINLAAFLLLTPLERWLQRRAGARKPPPEPRPPPTR